MRKMKRNRRWIGPLVSICMAACMVFGGAVVSYAASSRKTISKVSVTLDLQLEAGESLPDLEAGKDSGFNVRAGNDRYVATEAQWVSSTSKDVKIGSTYTLKVWLEAEDPDTYGFVGTYKASNVTVKGGTFVSASRKGYDTLIVTMKTKPVKGEYEAPDEAEWKQNQLGHAKWDKVSGVDAYDVTLYKGNSAIYKVKAYRGTTINFYPYMTSAGTYSFKVRSTPSSDNQKDYADSSDWTESDEIYVAKESVSDGSGKIDYNNTNSAANNSTTQVGWIQDGSRWWYRYPDGTYQKDSWLYLNNIWYLFDKDGWMLTGWQEKNGNWYYLDNNGAMRKGWVQATNGWYYLNPGPEGTEGAMFKNQWLDSNGKRYYLGENGVMCEGWTQVGGNWYYFYPGDGSMAVNTTISTFYVGADGVWRR